MTQFTHAICRRPGPDFAAGLTTVDLPPSGPGAPDFAALCAQHDAYVDLLSGCGLAVTVLPPLPGYPDAHFVEDVAVITPEVAVVTRPGHPQRRGEEDAIAAALAALDRPVARIIAPGTCDGGDVLQFGRRVFVGVTSRTNAAGAAQLAEILAPHGRTVVPVPLAAGLHLKSSVNEVGDALVVTAACAERPELADCPRLVVPAGEEYAANALRIGAHLLLPAGYPGTRRLLAATGLTLHELETGELRKMDGGLTCLSLRCGAAAAAD